MTDEPVLRAADLVVERGDDRILDGLSLSISAGDRILVRGPSGAGKTTLFQVLGLLATPDGGDLYVDGRAASGLSERRRAALRRTRVGLVFQDFQLVEDLTAWENARLPQEHANDVDEAWLADLFEALAIGDRRAQYPDALSGGERQRVAIARALANRPSVVLADEPTGQLDPDTAERVLDLLLSVQDEADAALAVISHDRGLTGRFADVYELSDGGIDPA
ncbi:ABC transporter ATP-binding protein [Halomicrobium salinisoli]|uniref:ABC transporter ATP-binding protein n=1 Tax=Halomicrobium salinisoli TaxID=2878391 RepID=UPI001CEFBC6E|nr:ATP-binding cassette domain-containing protein [Halomicrobium salinisoli]